MKLSAGNPNLKAKQEIVMTKDEALKLALDLATMHHTDEGYAEMRSKVRVAIKQALAQPAQGPHEEWPGQSNIESPHNACQHRGYCKQLKARPAQPAQEPVAWIVEFENGEQELHWNDTKAALGETQTPLYDTPQQRPWVGLTDEEIQKSYAEAYKVAKGRRLEAAFAQVIDAALRSKNT